MRIFSLQPLAFCSLPLALAVVDELDLHDGEDNSEEGVEYYLASLLGEEDVVAEEYVQCLLGYRCASSFEAAVFPGRCVQKFAVEPLDYEAAHQAD